MEEEQMICEMAVMRCRRNPQAKTAKECFECDFKNGMCDAYGLAEQLHNVNYRQIPKGAVVLTREEYAELTDLSESYDALENQYLNLMKKAGDIRKETASEISSDISKAIKIKEDIYGREYQIIYEDEILKLKKKLKEKYDAEVKE